MVRGRNISAEIEVPDTVEIPRRRKYVELVARISLHNNGEEDFVAHARCDDDGHFWHVLDSSQREVMRHKRKKGAEDVKVHKGVHSYVTKTVAGGHCVHGERKLILDGRKLKDGQTYTVRGEVYGHSGETTFVAVAEAPPRSKRRTKGKKVAEPKKAAKKRSAAKKKKR